MRKADPFVVACIPAYNEESGMGAVIVRTRGYVDEVLVCGDGSRGLTGAIAEGLGSVVIRHEINGASPKVQSAFLEVIQERQVTSSARAEDVRVARLVVDAFMAVPVPKGLGSRV